MEALLVRDARQSDGSAVAAVTLSAYQEYAPLMPALWDAYRDNIVTTLAAPEPATQIVAEQGSRIVGAVLLLGALVTLTVFAHISVFGREWFVHTLIGGAALIIVGTQVIGLGLCGRAFGVHFMGERDPWFQRMEARFRLEHGLLLGGAFMLAGLVAGGFIVGTWIGHGFGTLGQARLAILAATFTIAGIQIFFTSFLLVSSIS